MKNYLQDQAEAVDRKRAECRRKLDSAASSDLGIRDVREHAWRFPRPSARREWH